MTADEQKKAAAIRALDYVKPGMKLGLGTGSTAEHFVRALGEKVKQGLEVVGVPTSERTGKLAASLGIPLSNLDDTPHLDITVDGADYVEENLPANKTLYKLLKAAEFGSRLQRFWESTGTR